jgi:hypothetical protein
MSNKRAEQSPKLLFASEVSAQFGGLDGPD